MFPSIGKSKRLDESLITCTLNIAEKKNDTNLLIKAICMRMLSE